MSSPQMKLTPEERENVLRDINVAKQTLSELSRFERIGQDVTEHRKRLEMSIKNNEAILNEFG